MSKVNKYEKQLLLTIANGLLANALCLGYELGIFEALKKFSNPVTSKELAKECNLKERYLQEWLGCMVAANIVEVDEDTQYFMQTHWKDALWTLCGAGLVPRTGSMLDKVEECFKKDGPKGFSYDMLEVQLLDLIDGLLLNQDQLILTILEEVGKLKGTIKTVLEVGCGEGNLARALGKAIPQSNIYAIDYNAKSIERAKELHSDEITRNVTYVVKDVTNLPLSWKNQFDIILLRNVLHDLPNPVPAVAEIRRVLKDDGVAVIIDPGLHSLHKDNRGIMNSVIGFAISCFICLPNSMNLHNAAGLGMGWGMEMKQKFLEENGFIVKKHDFNYGMFCIKKPSSRL